MGKTSWGSWSKQIVCPAGVYVSGFRLRMDGMDSTDNSALNGIQLRCTDGTDTEKINGHWGTWSSWVSCDNQVNQDAIKYISGFNFRSQEGQGRVKDNLAGVDVKMQCNDNKELFGNELDKGSWDSSTYQECPTSQDFCGVQASIEPKRGGTGDDTALNKMSFLCCRRLGK